MEELKVVMSKKFRSACYLKANKTSDKNTKRQAKDVVVQTSIERAREGTVNGEL